MLKTIKCKKCNNNISNNDKICKYCGEKIKNNSILHKIGQGLVIFILIIICVSIIGSFFIDKNSTSTNYTNQQYVNVQKKPSNIKIYINNDQNEIEILFFDNTYYISITIIFIILISISVLGFYLKYKQSIILFKEPKDIVLTYSIFIIPMLLYFILNYVEIDKLVIYRLCRGTFVILIIWNFINSLINNNKKIIKGTILFITRIVSSFLSILLFIFFILSMVIIIFKVLGVNDKNMSRNEKNELNNLFISLSSIINILGYSKIVRDWQFKNNLPEK